MKRSKTRNAPNSLILDRERETVQAIAALADGNPFAPERVDNERRILGRRFTERSTVWHADRDLREVDPNLLELGEAIERLVPSLRERLVAGVAATPDDLLLYEACVRHLLFQRYAAEWWMLIDRAERGQPTTERIPGFARFVEDVRHFLHIDSVRIPVNVEPAQLFAWGFQIRRAFHQTYRQIFGGSNPAAALRAAVWQSIFTHDTRRYRRALFDRMGEATTLITGESGTGKELVARAIAFSRFIPFDAKKQCFESEYAEAFHAVNLMALSPTLIESELFGHRRGSFTGALETRAGWLETAGPLGSVFLDEIGELEGSVAGEATARSSERKLSAYRRDDRTHLPRESHRRHQPRPGHRDPDGAVSQGSLLPALLRHHHHPYPARATVGHTIRLAQHAIDPGAAHRRHRRSQRPRQRNRELGRAPPRQELRLARQCPRARAVRAQRPHSRRLQAE